MRMPEATWTTYVINLPDASKRRAHLLSRLACMEMRFVVQSAVDGQLLSEAEVEQAYDAELNRRLFKRPGSTFIAKKARRGPGETGRRAKHRSILGGSRAARGCGSVGSVSSASMDDGPRTVGIADFVSAPGRAGRSA